MRLRNVWVYGFGLSLAVTIAACGGGGGPETTSSAPAGTPAGGAGSGQKVDPATASDVKGTVTLEGSAPRNEPIKMNADPVCLKEAKGDQAQETYMVKDGKVANVFVYVKDGLGNYMYDPP